MHFHGALDLQYVLFLLLRVFFLNLVSNSKFLAPFEFKKHVESDTARQKKLTMQSK